MRRELSQKLAQIMNVHDVSLDERSIIVDAAQEAETFNDLSVEVKDLLRDIENRPTYGE